MSEKPINQETNVNPLSSFQSDDLIEKLKLLNYEKLLLHELKMKPLSRFYFVKSVNPGEQFFMFTLICWFLCKKLGKDMEQPQEFDDPNIITAKIIQILNEMDVPVNFPPNKLIRGAGPICLNVLDALATQALKVAKIICQKPIVTEEDEDAVEYLEDNAEIILEKLDGQQTGLSDDSDMELDGSTFRNLNWISKQARSNGRLDDAARVQESNEKLADQESWREELERVLPHLKVYVKADIRDWRSHLGQMKTLKANIEEISEETQTQLKKLHNEFTFTLDKIESREKHLNNELRSLIEQFKDVSIQLSSVQYAQTEVQTDMERMTTELNEVIMENDTKKTEMEQRGQSMSDGSKSSKKILMYFSEAYINLEGSVIQIRKAIAKLSEETSHLNLEVALLLHTITQEEIRQARGFIEADTSTYANVI